MLKQSLRQTLPTLYVNKYLYTLRVLPVDLSARSLEKYIERGPSICYRLTLLSLSTPLVRKNGRAYIPGTVEKIKSKAGKMYIFARFQLTLEE